MWGDRTCHSQYLARSRRHAVSPSPSWPAAPWTPPPRAPASVGIPGNYQSEAGCAGDWDPACPATQLVYDANGDIWRNTFSITPAGAYEYKVALNGSWDVNYGLHAQQNGPNIPLATTASPQSVTFYYDHKTHWVTENVSSIIATVPGSFQSEIGCSGDWDPALLPLLAAGHQRHVYLQLQHQRHSRRLLRGQGGAQRQLGCELRPGRRAERAEHRVHGAGQWHGSGVPVELHDQGTARSSSAASTATSPRRRRTGCRPTPSPGTYPPIPSSRCSRIRTARSRSMAPASSPGRIRSPGRSRTIRRACRPR